MTAAAGDVRRPPLRDIDVHDADAIAADLTRMLAVPPPLAPGGDNPNGPRWWHQSLSKGAAGVGILHAVRGTSIDDEVDGVDRVYAWLSRAVREDLSVGSGAGLWFGAPAVAFAIAVCAPHRYRSALARLDAAIGRLACSRLDAAHARMAASIRPASSEFDLVRGLTGLGAYLLVRDPGGELIRRVLVYLVRLTEPVTARDEAGAEVPGWWTSSAPFGWPEASAGHADLGMAHGICGPLALLALAMRRGVTVSGHTEAIDRIGEWLDTWRQHAPTGPWWPERVALADVRAGRPPPTGPARPSWCYGTPGITRAQQLAALARGDRRRQADAEYALARCVADPAQLARIVDPYLCHGWAGLAATVWYAAADAHSAHLNVHLPHLLRALRDHVRDTPHPAHPGLIHGSAGVALTLHTIATPTPRATPSATPEAAASWPTCLLIN